MIHMKKPAKNNLILISIGGMSGAGKTTLADSLMAVFPEMVFIDADRLRKALFGFSPDARLPKRYWSLKARLKLTEEMHRQIKQALAAGKSVVVSGTHIHTSGAAKRALEAKEHGARLVGIWLQAKIKTLFYRAAHRRPGNPSNARVDTVKEQLRLNPQAPEGWTVVDAAQTKEQVLAGVVKIIMAARKSPAAQKTGKMAPS